MTQEQFTYLTAMAAVGLAPIMMTTAGHVSPDCLKELARLPPISRTSFQRGADEIPSDKRGALMQVRAAREPAAIVSHEGTLWRWRAQVPGEC
jgi:hypothetical protein